MCLDSTVKKRQWMAFLFGLSLIMGLGCTKLYLGIVNHRPIGFLIFFVIVALLSLFVVVRPGLSRTSALGKKLLGAAERRFSWAKESSRAPSYQEEDLFYAVAIFGVTPVIGSELGSSIGDPTTLLNAPNSTSGGCGGEGGCGGGCGGGGCGGGCGGCG